MGRPKKDAPSATWSKAWNQWVIRLSGEDIPLGVDGGHTLEARRTAALGEWYQRGKQPRRHRNAAVDLTIDDMILKRVEHVEAKYRADGRDSAAEITAMGLAFRTLRAFHATDAAADFSVEKLERIRDAISSGTLMRKGRLVTVTKTWVDKCIAYIKRLFKWAARKRLIPTSVYADLSTLPTLNRYETEARVDKPVEAVDDAAVAAIKPFLPPTCRDMLEVQYLTGMRPGELCQMTGSMIDRTCSPWRYTPAKRKTDRHGWNPAIHLGEACQAILRPYIEETSGSEPLFSPKRALEERNALKRSRRKSNVQPSQISRRRASPRKSVSDRYTTTTYRRMLEYAMKQAIKHGQLREDQKWHPHQIRHNAARAFARSENMLAAQILLGHKDVRTTMRYIGYDERHAAALAERIDLTRAQNLCRTGTASATRHP